MYWVLFIIITIGFLAIIYHFYPKISSYIKSQLVSSKVLEVKEKIRELDNEEKKRKEELNSKTIHRILSTVNEYLNMPYEFIKKMGTLYGLPLFYKIVDPFTKIKSE